MKKLLAAVASLAVVAAPMAASAQSYGHGRFGENWGGRGMEQHYNGGAGAYRGYSRDLRGGGYSRDDRRSDIAGVAIVAGLAGLLLGSALSNQQSYGYSQPYAQPYAQPSGYQAYGYSPAYDYQPGW